MSDNSGVRNQQDQLAILNRLVEISVVLNTSLSTEEILEELMSASAAILNAESASVILMDPRTHELHFVAVTKDAQHSEKLSRVPVPIDNSIAGMIVRENKNIILDDVTEHPLHFRVADDKSGFRTRSLLGVPMRIQDRVVGALEAVNKIDARWNEQDEHYLEILASQAAIALEKAALVNDLRHANDELSKLDKLKSDFIAIASHELRTPLGVILGYASFLKEEAQGELGDHATAVLNSALRMRGLIEDMTNLRLINLGSSELQLEQCSINDMLRMASQDAIATAEARNQRLLVGMMEEDVFLRADRSKIIISLTNLLNNSVKFTPPNGQIRMGVLDRPNEVWIRIQDNGVGVPKENLEDIFKTFAQVEDHMTRRHGGMGLGLSIAKAIVEAHGGRIWAESEGVNKGSTFTLTLPK